MTAFDPGLAKPDALVQRGVGAAERPRLMGTVASAISDPGRPGRLRDFSEDTKRLAVEAITGWLNSEAPIAFADRGAEARVPDEKSMYPPVRR